MAAFGLFYTTNAAQLNARTSDNDEAVTIMGQYQDYPNLRDLTNNTDAIIVGNVVEVIGTHGHPAADYITVTDFAVTVQNAIKGDLQKGDTITVQQLGGQGALSDADRLMTVGEKYVLFLGYNPEFANYAALGGPQGKFFIQNEKVYSMDNIDPKASFVNTKVKDKAVSEFLSEVSAYVSEEKKQ